MNRLWIYITVLVLMAGTAAAQDARSVLQAASRTMGSGCGNHIFCRLRRKESRATRRSRRLRGHEPTNTQITVRP